MSSEVQEEQKVLKGIDVPSAIPTQDTFDLDAFIQQKSTVPVVGATVYLDADGGMQLQNAMNRKAQAEARLAELETMPNPVIGVGEENPLLQAKTEAQQVRDLAQIDIDTLTTRVIDSALYIEFQHDTTRILDSQRAARESLPEDADENMTAQEIQKSFMLHAAAATCIRITNSEQKTIEGPFTVERMESLHSNLIQSEGIKMFDAMNEAIGVGSTWSEQLDAGFPGRSADVAR